mgnify:CR=1 FL=1
MSFFGGAPKLDLPSPIEFPTNPVEEEARQKALADTRVDQAMSRGQLGNSRNLLGEEAQGGMVARPSLGGSTLI